MLQIVSDEHSLEKHVNWQNVILPPIYTYQVSKSAISTIFHFDQWDSHHIAQTLEWNS